MKDFNEIISRLWELFNNGYTSISYNDPLNLLIALDPNKNIRFFNSQILEVTKESIGIEVEKVDDKTYKIKKCNSTYEYNYTI